MVPICRDTGSVIAFGGRSMDADQVPKYLNSPETAIYSKGRTLYGLNLTKAGIRKRRVRRPRRGLFRLRAGVPDRGGAGGRLVRHGADAAAGAAAAAIHDRRSCSATTPTRPARARRRARASCWSTRGSTSTSWCWTRAKIPIRSFDGRARTSTAKGCAVRGRIWNTCSIRPPRDSTFGARRQRRQFLAEMLTVAARIPERGGARPVRRPDRAQGADYGRGRPGRNSKGRRQPPDDPDGAGAAERSGS